MRVISPLVSSLLAALCASACSNGGGSSSSSSSGTTSGGTVSCNSPSGTVTLCDIQNPSSAAHPGVGTQVTLPRPVTVASAVWTLSTANAQIKKAFFVSESPGGAYRGALVYGDGAMVDALNLAVGSQVLLQVTIEEYQGTGTGSETQLKLVGGNVTGTAQLGAPTSVPTSAFSADSTAARWEGVLIKVDDATSTRFDSGAITDHGSFNLVGGLRVGDNFFHYAVGLGEHFTSLTGFVRYSYDGHWTLEPRDANDIVSTGPARSYQDVDVTKLRDPANLAAFPHCIAPLECDPVRLTNMVVTGVPRQAAKDANGASTLYHVFVQDPTLLDAGGEPLAYSAVKVVFPKTGLTTNLSLDTYGATLLPDNQHPEGWPMPGDIITVEGSIQEYFGMTQLGNVSVLNRTGRVTDSPAPLTTVPRPKAFDGTTDLTALSGGTVGLAECSFAAVAPGADSKKWESTLIQLNNATTTMACVPTVTTSTTSPACVRPDFGYFQVANGVEIGTGEGAFFSGRCPTGSVCTCEGPTRVPTDSRAANKVYTSITGLLHLSFSVYRLEPRCRADATASPPKTCPAGMDDVVERP